MERQQEFPSRIFISKTILFDRYFIIIFDHKKCIVMRLICSLYTLPKVADPKNYIHLRCYYRSGCSVNVIRVYLYIT